MERRRPRLFSKTGTERPLSEQQTRRFFAATGRRFGMRFQGHQGMPTGQFAAEEQSLGFASCIGFFVLGLGMFLNVRIVGYVTGTELIALPLLPLLAMNGYFGNMGKSMQVLLILGCVWLASAIGTDIYRHNELAMMARGSGRVLAFIIMLVELYVLLRKHMTGLSWLMAGAFISSVVSSFGFQAGAAEFVVVTGEDRTSSWERDYALMTVVFAFWLSTWLFENKPLRTVWILAVLGVLNIFMGARNMGATMIIAALAVSYFRFWPEISGQKDTAKGAMFLAKAGLVLALVGGIVYGSYKFSASQGWLGEQAKIKLEGQTSNGRLGMLLTSRIDFVAGLMAIRESPVVGYGSWAPDDEGFLAQAYEYAGITESVKGGVMYSFFNRIPTHSALLEAWVEHGLLATGFWWGAIWIILKVSACGAFSDKKWGLFITLIATWVGWNILFSPFSMRGFYAVVLVFIVLYYEKLRPEVNCGFKRGIRT